MQASAVIFACRKSVTSFSVDIVWTRLINVPSICQYSSTQQYYQSTARALFTFDGFRFRNTRRESRPGKRNRDVWRLKVKDKPPRGDAQDWHNIEGIRAKGNTLRSIPAFQFSDCACQGIRRVFKQGYNFDLSDLFRISARWRRRRLALPVAERL